MPGVKEQYLKILNAIRGKSIGEADSATSNAQVLRAQESSKPKRPLFQFHETRFREAKDGGKSRFSSVIIQEGMGNFQDAFYYTREALESAVDLFEGKKIYADHPTKLEEEVIPERSVRDILGHFENVRVTEAEDGHAMLEADVVILPEAEFDWARGLMRHAVDYSKKFPERDFVGLSINANGEAEAKDIEEFLKESGLPEYCRSKLVTAVEKGVTSVRVVNKLTDAISCDLVTEAGAGGRVTKMIEGESVKKKTKKVKEADQMHPAGGAVEAQEQHDDAAQDMELIKSMLKKHDADAEHTDMDEKMCSEAYSAAKEMGMEGEEAEKAAVMHMKMMKKIGEKMAKSEEKCETESEEKAKEDDVHVDVGSHKGEEEEEEEPKEEPEAEAQESAKPDEAIRLRGTIAMLEKKVRKYELAEHLEKKLSECGEDRLVTKIFREGIDMTKIKSTKEIDAKWDNFIEGYRAGRQNAGYGTVTINVEKRGESTGKGLSFEDCIS